jgi:signal transduction histidine kinase
MIEQRIKKLDAVIGDILQLSRSSKAELKIELVDFNNLMAEIVSDIKFNQGADKIQLHYSSNPEHLFKSDAAQVKIILNNLVTNAIKYHRLNQDDPFIKVSFQKHNAAVVITVSDNGEGIAPDNQDKIFEMFYRASSSSDGTGLGLYIVKEAVNKLNGKIEVESRLHVGSTFIVTLPVL